MKINLENVSGIKRKMVFEIPADSANNVRNSIINKLKKTANIKGFRAGKAPRNVIENLYGDQILQQLTEDLISEHMPAAFKEKNVEPMGIPMLEDCTWNEGEDFVVTLTFEIKPEFSADNWESLELNQIEINISDENINKNLEQLRQRIATVSAITEDRAIKEKGDIVDIKYTGFDKETAIKELSSKVFPVEVGEGRFFPEFEKALPGMKKGETKDIFVDFPKEHSDKKLAGKKICFKTTVEAIKERNLPPLDDDMAKDFDMEGVSTLIDLKNKIKEDLIKNAERQNEISLQKQITEKLNGLADFEIPTALIEGETENMVETLKQNLRQSQIDPKQINLDENKLKENYRQEAEKNVKSTLILGKIAENNKIEATEEDIEEELNIIAKQYNQNSATMRDFHDKNNLMDSLKNRLKIHKTFKLIESKANITMLKESPQEENIEIS